LIFREEKRRTKSQDAKKKRRKKVKIDRFQRRQLDEAGEIPQDRAEAFPLKPSTLFPISRPHGNSADANPPANFAGHFGGLGDESDDGDSREDRRAS
jgi:hypothetical protein